MTDRDEQFVSTLERDGYSVYRNDQIMGYTVVSEHCQHLAVSYTEIRKALRVSTLIARTKNKLEYMRR